MKYLMKEKGTTRGRKREGICEKSEHLGVKAARNKHSFIESSLKTTNKIMWDTLGKYLH